MIRFLPDTWRDALLRPLAMAAPDGGVYIEIMAPDLRFVLIFMLVAVLGLLLLWRRRVTGIFKPAAVLLAATTAAFVPWMLTTGNGRYFIPFLLAAGPLCIAGVFLLPMTRGFRLALAACLVAVQAFVVFDASPLRSWALAQWQEAPYFQVDVPEDMAIRPGTYVTISSISYSLIAPLFPSSSRWINLSMAPSDADKTLAGRRANEFLALGAPLTMLAPSIPKSATAQGLPNAEALRAINVILAEHRLAIFPPNACQFLRSEGLTSSAGPVRKNGADASLDKFGFWACPLRDSVTNHAVRPEIAKFRFDAVFIKVETICPRFFRPGEGQSKVINGGEVRYYGESDMKVYVLDDGAVLYKYLRAYSPQLIGSMENVMSGKVTLDCDKIRGRSGLPWEREI